MHAHYDVVILGLSITSSWGNGHATTYRGLVQALAARGRRVLFLERDLPWYAANRDLRYPAGIDTVLYHNLDELITRYEPHIRDAAAVIVGSFVPDGIHLGEWVTGVARGVTAFYDIDTPITLEQLAAGASTYITPALAARYHLYLSFTGGPVLQRLESEYGVRRARELYCSVDLATYHPVDLPPRWRIGYLGTYSDDRQPSLHHLLLEPARHLPSWTFAVVGAQYPPDIAWPPNVYRSAHLPPGEHAAFYGSQSYTLNVTRQRMKQLGWSPSVRLFEAGACATPIISDYWEGLDHLFIPGQEILIAESTDDVLRHLRDLPDTARRALGAAARQRILAEHTPQRRADQLEQYLAEAAPVRTAPVALGA